MHFRTVLPVLVGILLNIFPANALAWKDSVPDGLGIDLHGFVDVRAGTRTQDDPDQGNTSLAEARLQTDITKMTDSLTFEVRTDFLYDYVADHTDLDLKEGTGEIDLREANVLFSPFEFMDVKAGRQILTWGTGDMLFINDLFPKDWQSFFIGRDEEYLKAPSDAVFISLFPEFATVDIAYTPRFDADRYIRGERVSFWNPALGTRSGADDIIDVNRPNRWFHDDELAVRLYRNVGDYEIAFYAYNGFWKSPGGLDPFSGRFLFPALRSYGASIQGPLGSGIYSFEAGHYVSRRDKDGDNPFINNSEIRLLTGYEKEVAKDFTARVQYYLEYMAEYNNYKKALPAGQKARDRDRHVLTLRLTKLLFSQNMTLSFFCYYSPSDEDAYLRPMIKYKLTDAWLVMAGGNIFTGIKDYTFFGQFEKNSNVYGVVRYSF
ncbi:MAG: hypothetical protein DRH37_00550 [Deltaproteobacteria bacterium]|nr:MAG: hypothetical protein DRH37_00550 [Deltaproteobacteria bacterium]